MFSKSTNRSDTGQAKRKRKSRFFYETTGRALNRSLKLPEACSLRRIYVRLKVILVRLCDFAVIVPASLSCRSLVIQWQRGSPLPTSLYACLIWGPTRYMNALSADWFTYRLIRLCPRHASRETLELPLDTLFLKSGEAQHGWLMHFGPRDRFAGGKCTAPTQCAKVLKLLSLGNNSRFTDLYEIQEHFCTLCWHLSRLALVAMQKIPSNWTRGY